MQYITEQEIERITSDTCRQLAKEKRVSLRIVPENGEPFWEGGINGHFFRVPTGIPVEVPESLAALIASGRRVRVESAQRAGAYARDGGKRIG